MINSIFLATFVVLFATYSATTIPNTVHQAEEWETNPLVVGSPEVLRKLRALRQNVRDTGCDVNLCFALQGDEFITDEDFEDQKNFVDLMVAILTTDKPGNYCAVQYGLTTKHIHKLSGEKRNFLKDVRKAQRVGGDLETNIAAALGYTGFQLISREEDANKIIILGDGLESIGFAPKRIAKVVRARGVDICAVAVGGFSTVALQDIVGGDLNKIFTIDGFFELAEVVYGFVNDVCGFGL